MNPRVVTVSCMTGYKLELTFTNGEARVFDVSPYLHYPVYEPLADEAYFRKAHVISGTVIWDDYIDFDPDTLYLEGKPVIVSVG